MSEDIQQQISKLNQQVEKLYQQGRYEEAIQPASQARDLASQYLDLCRYNMVPTRRKYNFAICKKTSA